MPRIKKVPFPPWHTGKNDGIEKRFIRLGASIMASEAMLDLSNAAFRAYVYMMIESAGNREFTFPHNKYKSYMTKPTFFKARQELIEHGFIDIVQNNRNLRKANKYRFSEQWKAYIKS